MNRHNCKIYEFDVALSFAGEERKYIEKVASYLRKSGLKVFYDEYEKINLWGKDLYQHLDKVYQQTSKYVVVFISTNYAKKLWTSHELKSAQARAFSENEEYILPARFDETEIPGIRKTIGYIDLKEHTPSAFAKLIISKLNTYKLENILPSEAVRLKQLLKIENWELDEEEDIDFICQHIFSVLKLLSYKEKFVIAKILLEGCTHNLPDDIHIDLNLLSRHTSISEEELITILNGLSSLGFEYEIKSEICGSKEKGNLHEEKLLSLTFTPVSADIDYSNIILFLYYMIYSSTYGQCKDCTLESILRLDFSSISDSFTEEEIEELTPYDIDDEY